MIPLLPGYTFPIDTAEASSVRLILECQNRTISRGAQSIFSRLKKEGIDVGRFSPQLRFSTLTLYVISLTNTSPSLLCEDGASSSLEHSRPNRCIFTARYVGFEIDKIVSSRLTARWGAHRRWLWTIGWSFVDLPISTSDRSLVIEIRNWLPSFVIPT